MKVLAYVNWGLLRLSAIPLFEYKGEIVYCGLDITAHKEPYNVYGSAALDNFNDTQLKTIDLPDVNKIEIFKWIFSTVKDRGDVKFLLSIINKQKK